VTEERDVVIIGGGPAGTTTAIALAHASKELASRALLLERAKFPREKPCAGALGGRGVAILEALDAVPDVPHVSVDGISFRAVGGEISARASRIGRVVRRIEFDHALAKIAAARGVEVRDATRVDAVRADGRGAVVETDRGAIRARVVVGADGVGSIVRKSIGLPAGAMRAQVLEVDTPPRDEDRDRALLHFDAADRTLPGYTWDFPTVVDGEPLVCRGIYKLKTTDDDADIHALFAERLRAMGFDLATLKNKRYAERGFAPSERVALGPMMLVGEAAGIDPVTGEGIAQAIEFGDMAGRFVARVLSDGESVEHWNDEVRRSRLARDLRIRVHFVPYFYGPSRPHVEQFLLESPDALFVGGQHFAAQRYDWMKLAEVVTRGAARIAGLALERALAR
jgi:flavin-dependent dehydrogenase